MKIIKHYITINDNSLSKEELNIKSDNYKIIGLFSCNKVGDKAQALGVIDEIQQLERFKLTNKICIEKVEIPVQNINELIQVKDNIIKDLLAGKQVILVMSGFSINLSSILQNIKYDLEKLSASDLYKNIISVATSHELSQEFLSNKLLSNITAIPITSLNNITLEQLQKLTSKTHLERTFGVAHDLSDIQIKNKCKIFDVHSKHTIRDINEESILIVLGGDYESIDKDGNKIINRLSKEEAVNLTKSIYKKFVKNGRKPNFLILDSPRTGICDENGNLLIDNPHKIGKVNEVIQGVVDILKEYECEVQMFSLMLNEKPVVSALAPALKKFAEFKNYKAAIVTGESTTMVTQLFGILPKLSVAYISSMNNEHKDYIDELFRLGIINKINLDGIFEEHDAKEILHITPAAKQIAYAIDKYIYENFK